MSILRLLKLVIRLIETEPRGCLLTYAASKLQRTLCNGFKSNARGVEIWEAIFWERKLNLTTAFKWQSLEPGVNGELAPCRAGWVRSSARWCAWASSDFRDRVRRWRSKRTFAWLTYARVTGRSGRHSKSARSNADLEPNNGRDSVWLVSILIVERLKRRSHIISRKLFEIYS